MHCLYLHVFICVHVSRTSAWVVKTIFLQRTNNVLIRLFIRSASCLLPNHPAGLSHSRGVLSSSAFVQKIDEKKAKWLLCI